MNDISTTNKKKQSQIKIFFDKEGISIIDLLELDFSEFVSKFIKEKIK